MNAYLSRLNPAERRFVVGVALLFFIVINIFWVWPHFSDWGNLKNRLATARGKLEHYDSVLRQKPILEAQIKKLASEGFDVPQADRQTELLNNIQVQAAQAGVGYIGNPGSFMRTNEFFIDQLQTISVEGGEKQLVDFLYSLGSGNSLIRVRDLTVHPDVHRQKLNANVTLVASYQKNVFRKSPTRRVTPAARTGSVKSAAPKKP